MVAGPLLSNVQRMGKLSAGIVAVRFVAGQPEILLAHPGGPLWARKDCGVWTIPKGEVEPGEDLFLAARREFAEEIGGELSADRLVAIGSVTQKSGKVVWGFATDEHISDEIVGNVAELASNRFTMEWPPRSGVSAEFPEVDRAQFFSLDEALRKVNAAQIPLLQRAVEAFAAQEPGRLAIVGRGRMGTALVGALAGWAHGPFERGFDGIDASGQGYDVVLLAVPDGEIASAVGQIAPGPIVGHCSGATGLDVLAPHPAFSVHPLMTVTADGAEFHGAGGAIAATTPAARLVAELLAERLGLVTVDIADDDRVAYHAAASIAANFLTTLEDAAEQLLATAGADRQILVPLVTAAVDNWARRGKASLTGPISRRDVETVARHRAVIAERTPHLLAMFDVMVERTLSMIDGQ